MRCDVSIWEFALRGLGWLVFALVVLVIAVVLVIWAQGETHYPNEQG